MSVINGVLVQLFNLIEQNSGFEFNTFTTNDESSQGNLINKDQPLMKMYKNKRDARVYKYLYDPNLSFDYRFHQRLSLFTYEDKKKPWVTLMFNTGQVQPLTNVLSHTYVGYETFEDDDGKTRAHEYWTRRVRVPINFILISNDMSYLYSVKEMMSFYFDRFINFHYNSSIIFDEKHQKLVEEVGQAADITQVDLTKLDTEYKGSLVTSAFKFDLIYFVNKVPGCSLGLLEKIIWEVKVAGMDKPMVLSITE